MTWLALLSCKEGNAVAITPKKTIAVGLWLHNLQVVVASLILGKDCFEVT